MTTPIAFTCASPEPIRFDKKLGRCVGWACYSKKDGEKYVDLHGDHFPDDELFAAVDALNHLPIEKREINVEHAGPGRGSIVSSFALTEDFATTANPPIDTGGTYGVLVSFKPDAALLKSIEDGVAFCLSIEGMAYDVETIAKSAGADIAATAHKRTMRKVQLTKLAVVQAGAHEGAAVTLVKSAADPIAIWKAAAAIAKRTPALTTVEDGHQHLIGDTDEQDGYTSWDSAMSTPYGGHSHAWIKNPDGSIAIAVAAGHTHALAGPEPVEKKDPTMPTELEKSQADTIAKRDSRITALTAVLVACAAMPAEQAAYVRAQKMDADAIEAFLGKSADERTKLATPLYKSERLNRTYYAGSEELAEMAKDADAQFAKAAGKDAEATAAGFAKTAAKIACNFLGGQDAGIAIVRATAALPEAERKLAEDAIAAANQTLGTFLRTSGSSGGAATGDASDPKVALEKAAEAFIKSRTDLSAVEARREFGRSDEGQRLYAAAYPSSRSN